MWKKEDVKTQGVPEISTGSTSSAAPSAVTPNASPSYEPAAVQSPSLRAGACISQGIKIKGEVTGSEDLFVDGQVDGKLNLVNGSLTVGPNGIVKADVIAREVIVRGRVEGKVSGRDKVQVSSTGQVSGDIQTDRLAIEDGAMMRGKVEAGRLPARSGESQSGALPAAGPSTSKSSSAMAASSGTAAD